MTRVLAELLGAKQPDFGLLMRRLERAAGWPAVDIRLTSSVRQQYRQKMKELGLDPDDTTAEELYQALQERFRRDEQLYRDALGVDDDATPEEILFEVQRFTKQSIKGMQSFALKTSTAKRLVRAVPPKKTMKLLNYRSLDSLLKHESIPAIVAAANELESNQWRKKYHDQYKRLASSDFEQRPIEVCLPQTGRWEKLAITLTRSIKHNVITVRELGAVVLLPLAERKSGLAAVDTLLVLHGANDIAATSSYLKLQQVRPGFGEIVHDIASDEPRLVSEATQGIVPWKIIHTYYNRNKGAFNPLIFEPHIQLHDFGLCSPEAVLAKLQPSFDFWQNNTFAAHSQAGKQVSLNLLDAAINYYNHVPFASSIHEYMRRNLWQELMVRYLRVENIEHALSQNMQLEPVFSEVDDRLV